MPSGVHPMQPCSRSRFAPRTRESTSNQNWLIPSSAQSFSARIPVVPSSPPLLDCSDDFHLQGADDRTIEGIKLLARLSLFRQTNVTLGQIFPIRLLVQDFLPCELGRG